MNALEHPAIKETALLRIFRTTTTKISKLSLRTLSANISFSFSASLIDDFQITTFDKDGKCAGTAYFRGRSSEEHIVKRVEDFLLVLKQDDAEKVRDYLKGIIV